MDALIVGLGNPGEKYKNTRHNFGFILLDKLCNNLSNEKRFKSEIGEIRIANLRILCIKPQTYMNLSGEAVQSIASFYQIPAKDCLVLHDELDLEFGILRLKFGGGEGGHNGLKSISQHMASRDYARLRMGIGKPEAGNRIPIEEWVLQRFSADQKSKLDSILDLSEKAVISVFEMGFNKAQNVLNSTPLLV